MITGKHLQFLILIIYAVFLSSCITTEPVILHGDISGSVNDAETSDPVQAALIELIQEDNIADSARTGNDGSFLMKNITPGIYTLQASKYAYSTVLKDIEVEEAKTGVINLGMGGIPIPDISETYLDFGLDKSTMKFIISNAGKKKLSYVINTSKDWINVNPFSGEILDEHDTITITIDRTGLSDSIVYKEKVEITSTGGPDPLQDTLGIYMNGVMDIRNLRYYKTVKIGTQTWMAENINVGEMIPTESNMWDNALIEKMCYYDMDVNCNVYGGLYDWIEAMDYNPSDSGIVGTTKGICPEGYHMPTGKEWQILIDYLGGNQIAGAKLKETGTIHWDSPNKGATNESGFTALPGGFIEGTGQSGIPVLWSYEIKEAGFFWTATIPSGADPIFNTDIGSHFELNYNNTYGQVIFYQDRYLTCSVRCIKNP